METKDNAQFYIIQVQGWIEKEGKFLLAQRSLKELQAPGAWALPGGKVENDIGPNVIHKQLKQEVLEEVGVEITDEIELVYDSAFVRVDGAHVVGFTFLCRWKSGEAKALEDTADIKWFTLDELLAYNEAEDYIKREINALAHYLQK